MLRFVSQRTINAFKFSSLKNGKKGTEEVKTFVETGTASEVDNTPEPGFLQMVEAYFEKAGNLTDISKDKLHFYKKS